MGTERQAGQAGQVPRLRRQAAEPDLAVVYRPPATPEEREDAWRRWVEAMDWLATLGAMDA
jgi:hypothetical protein